MSTSSLYGIRKDYVGEKLKEYGNSLLFSPVIWDILSEKYIPDEISTPYGYKERIVGINGEDIWRKANDKVNKCRNTPDRICWEMSNEQIFFTKDKKCITNGIRKFVEQNKDHKTSEEDSVSPLERAHIIKRFNEIAKDIEKLSEEKYPYFVLKNTSCDDGVEYWFENYNDETDEYKEKSLKEWDKFLTEFVVMQNGEITDFISNLSYKY